MDEKEKKRISRGWIYALIFMAGTAVVMGVAGMEAINDKTWRGFPFPFLMMEGILLLVLGILKNIAESGSGKKEPGIPSAFLLSVSTWLLIAACFFRVIFPL